MGRPRDDHALVIEAADPFAVDLARGLLEEAGIPCLVHGPDFDVGELGVVVHHSVRGANLYVPCGLGERARDVLQAAWGPLDSSGRPLEPPAEPEAD